LRIGGRVYPNSSMASSIPLPRSGKPLRLM
jgi:hypothetical protein